MRTEKIKHQGWDGKTKKLIFFEEWKKLNKMVKEWENQENEVKK